MFHNIKLDFSHPCNVEAGKGGSSTLYMGGVFDPRWLSLTRFVLARPQSAAEIYIFLYNTNNRLKVCH